MYKNFSKDQNNVAKLPAMLLPNYIQSANSSVGVEATFLLFLAGQ